MQIRERITNYVILKLVFVLKMMHTIFRMIKKFVAWNIFHLFPLDAKKIVVSNYQGRGYGDNPKYIIEELLNEKKQLDIIWIVNNQNEALSLPKGVTSCIKDSVKSIYHLSTAKVWIDNCRKGFTMYKRKKQFYIQTWHGFALKRIEKDVEDYLSDNYVKFSKYDSKMTDVIISDSTHMTNIYRNSFWYDGKILEIGSPRNDIITENSRNIREKVCDSLNILKEKKLVLYAPTFRNDQSIRAYTIDYSRLKLNCEKRFGGNFSVLIRLHPNIANNAKLINYDDVDYINATYYPDMQELLVAADIVVSDYSSLMVDFALSKKPCFQFAVDIDEYKADRNFYFDIEKLPFDLSKDNDELERNILNFDSDEYINSLNLFFESVGMIQTNEAAKKCARLVLDICEQ